MLFTFRIVKRSDGWHVVSEDGSKHLGGPYKTKEQARQRLIQVEEHKNKDSKMSRKLFAGFTLPVGQIRAGQWDRFFSWGPKNKDGNPLVFDATTLGQVVDNFAKRKNLVAMDYDHQTAYVSENGKPAPALAFYCALALVIDQQIIKFATRDESVKPLNPAGKENGVYGYRSEVTALGQELLPSYRYISPMFTDTGTDEAGNPIGYDLLCVAATNTPFQDGCEITFNNGALSPKKKGIKMASLKKRFGLDDDASPEEFEAAVGAYMKKMDDDADAAMKKMDDADSDAEAMNDGDGDADDMPKKMDDDAEAMGDADSDDEAMAAKAGDVGDARKAEFSKLAKELGCEPNLQSVYEAVRAIKLSTAPKTQLAETEKRVAALEAKLAKSENEKKHAEAVKFAKAAIKTGRWNEKDELQLVEARLENPKLAEKALAPEGTWTFKQRLTLNGSPISASVSVSDAGEVSIKEDPYNINAGVELANAAKKFAKENNVSLQQAYIALSKSDIAKRDYNPGQALLKLRFGR